MRRVLVVDDDHGIRVLAEDILRDAGYDVTTIGSAREALHESEARPPALLILDLSLPDGEEDLLHELIAARGAAPVLVLSGSVQIQERTAELGAHASLAKPFDVDEFIRVVNALIAPDCEATNPAVDPAS